MATQIKCPHCNRFFEPTDAYKHELEGRLLKATNMKHRRELERLEREKVALAESKKKEMEAVREETAKAVRDKLEGKIRKELETKIALVKEESQSQEKQNHDLQNQLKDMLKQMRELKNEKDTLAIKYEKRLLETQDRIKQLAKREAQDEMSLRIAEKEKKLHDAEKQILALQRKIQQGSQQLQGEVQELALEKLLKEAFPFDEIREVPKGVRGADSFQMVRNRKGELCGTILWESKNTKNWAPGWIQKLKDDQRRIKADLAVLVSSILPRNIRSFGFVEAVPVTDLQSALSLAQVLREQLIKVHSAYVANRNKATKAEVVYNYLISNEFKQRIEVWIDYFKNRRKQIDKERAYFTKKWEKEEKEILKIADSTAGIYGDIQGMVGNALPKVGYLELPESENDEKE